MVIFSQPEELVLIQLTCFASGGGRENDYHLIVYELDNPLKMGGKATKKFSVELNTLGLLVETLIELGHKRDDPIIRYAAQL